MPGSPCRKKKSPTIAPTTDSPATASSSPAPEPVVEEPPAEAAQPGSGVQDVVAP